MSRLTKVENGTYMGEQENHQKESPKSDNKSGNGTFKRGEILKGLPAHGTGSTPKAGYPDTPNFQNMRDQDPAEGTI